MDEKEKEILKYNRHLQNLSTIRNCVSIICFTILAIIFKHWWIVFGALIFFVKVGKDN